MASSSHGWRHWRSFWAVAKWPIGAVFALASWCVRLTARVTVQGGPVQQGPCVYVSWHRHVPCLLIHHGRLHRWQLMSPQPYMAPIAVWSTLMGMRSAQAQPGARMRDAFALLIKAVKDGQAAVVYVDGPAGPPYKAKPGCVELAMAAGVSIVPIASRTQWDVQAFWRWDRAVFPVPFERVDVRIGAPIEVPQGAPIEPLLERINAALNHLETLPIPS